LKFAGKLVSRRPPLAPNAEVIRALAGLLAETGLTEIEYAIGDHRIRVAREAAAPPPVNGHAAPSARPADNGTGVEVKGEAPAANGAGHPGTVTSPIVGIAYLAAEPGAAPFVRVGEPVSEGQTLLIIEAMKVMNQIRAPRAGRLAQIFVEDAVPVEYGAALMLIE
jgi:acetyl-CoA carboxylase biotin carboxyl carrier protein